ncbi:MAG: hypothetical protein KC547_21760, partial [Anaerolineae bacterium]|nr:hypothetical protein [Anaerolineae bacterium]
MAAQSTTRLGNEQPKNTMSSGWTRVLIWVTIIFITFWVLYPFAWAIITSFKTQRQALEPTFVPFLQFDPSIENWAAELGLAGRETATAIGN